MTNYETLAASLEDRWFFGIASSSPSLRQGVSSFSDLQNSNPEHMPETLHASPSAPNLRQRSTFKTGHLRRKPPADLMNATEKPLRGHVRRASTSSIDVFNQGGGTRNTAAQVAPANATTQLPVSPLPQPQGLGKPPRPEAPSRSSARSFLKAQNNTKDYAERRKAWKARLEATIAAPRLYTATVPVPTARMTGSRASSVQTTPSGSPKPPASPLSGADANDTATANGSAAQKPSPNAKIGDTPAVPAVWVGHSSDKAPHDFSALDDESLRMFLQQAGSSPGAAVSHEELVAAARSSKGAWEVERIVVGCSLPEHVLRVQKSDCTDPVILKAAWKKLAFQVHPDRCSADGASVAMAIAKDAFDILAWRAEQYQAEAAYAATHSPNKTTAQAAAAGQTAEKYTSDKTKLDIDGKDMARQPSRPLSAPAESNGAMGILPQPPLKVRVKLKVKKTDPVKPPASAAEQPDK